MRGYFDTRLSPEGLRATGHSVDGAVLTIDAEVLAAEVICPGCGQGSTRRHGRYVRHLTDFPAHGRSVQVRLSVRRFRCVASHCPTTTFSEQVPDCLACRYGRRTGRFQDLVAYLGRAMGGRPAQALGRRLRFGLSKDTFLRGAASGGRTMGCEPRVIGIDDWAWRKGQRYGTLICYLEQRAVIDLLPDRELQSGRRWSSLWRPDSRSYSDNDARLRWHKTRIRQACPLKGASNAAILGAACPVGAAWEGSSLHARSQPLH